MEEQSSREFRRRVARAAHAGILPHAVPANWSEKMIAERAWSIADRVMEWEHGDPDDRKRATTTVSEEADTHRRESMMTALTGLLPMAIANAWKDSDLAARAWKGADLIISWEEGDPENRSVSTALKQLNAPRR